MSKLEGTFQKQLSRHPYFVGGVTGVLARMGNLKELTQSCRRCGKEGVSFCN